jgi:acyl carrier protein
MTNDEKLHSAFVRILGLEPEEVNDKLAYGAVPNWDSLAHMTLVAELESVFEVMLDTEDIIAMSSLAEARRILGRHGVSF